MTPERTYGAAHRLDAVFALVRNSTKLKALAKTIFVATDFPFFVLRTPVGERMHNSLTLIAVVFFLVGTTRQDATAGGHSGSPHFQSTPKTSTNAGPRTNSLTADSVKNYDETRTRGIDSQISGGLGKQNKQQNHQGTYQQKQNCFKC
jgi:hypothetical protein